ncbi:hypothetical protein HI914_00483 [Erysiphe necator]|nr:hypothetical protein HI914_00483 [Erysiphe necator]
MLLPLFTICVALGLNASNALAMKSSSENGFRIFPHFSRNKAQTSQATDVQGSPASPLNAAQNLAQNFAHNAAHNAAPVYHPMPHMSPAHYQQFNQMAHTLHKMEPPRDPPAMLGATCGVATYSRDDIIEARRIGCERMPGNVQDLGSRNSVLYTPADPYKYMHLSPPPYYLYPLGKPIAGRKVKHFGFDRVVLNSQCNVISVLTESPGPSEMVGKAMRAVLRRPLKHYDQKKYTYKDCIIF